MKDTPITQLHKTGELTLLALPFTSSLLLLFTSSFTSLLCLIFSLYMRASFVL